MKQKFEATDPGIVRDLLLLVDIDIPEPIIATWTPQEQYAAQRYAARAYLRASDNPVRVPPEPEFITAARRGQGAVQTQNFASPPPQNQDPAPARRWARAWKNGARHYRDLFRDAVRQGVRYDMAIEVLINDILAGEIGPSCQDVLGRLYDIRREFP